MPNPPQFSHIMHWNRKIAGCKRKGQACKIVHEYKGQAHILFDDGQQAIISRRALRAAPKVAEANEQPA